jgi:hypothetical protein
MRSLNLVVLAVAGLVVLLLAIANRQVVAVNLAPDLVDYGAPAAPTFAVPLYVVALVCGAVGFILGALREYLRESGLRADSNARRREVGKLQREVDALKTKTQDEDDEIIALTSR